MAAFLLKRPDELPSLLHDRDRSNHSFHFLLSDSLCTIAISRTVVFY
jgi:hypothetical protein